MPEILTSDLGIAVGPMNFASNRYKMDNVAAQNMRLGKLMQVTSAKINIIDGIRPQPCLKQ